MECKIKTDCLHDVFEYREKGVHLGQYCAYCGKWLKWINHVKLEDFVMPYGLHKGKKFVDIPKDYLEWLVKNSKKNIAIKAEKVLKTL